MEENKRSMQQIAGEVAKALGSAWKLSSRFDEDGHDWRAEIDGPDGMALFLSNSWGGPGRLHISGNYAHECRADYSVKPEDNINITVDINKSGEKIAKDIERRLLPEYKEHFAQVMARHRLNDKHKFSVKETAALVAEIVGGSVQKNGDEYRPIVYAPSGSAFYRAEIYSDGRAILKDFSLTVEQLKRLKQALPELFKGGNDE